MTHTLAFGWAGLTAALLIAAHAPTPWLALRRWWPLLAGLVLPSAWVLSLLFVESIGEPPVGSSGYRFSRLLQVFTFTVGLPIQDLSLVVGILFFLLPFLTGGRLTTQKARWIPFLTALGIFAITPNFFLGTAFLHQRFTLFLLPTPLFALDVSRPAETHRRNWLLGLLAFVWLMFIQVQLLGFRYETGAFGELVEGMEPNRMMLYLPLDRGSRLVPYPVYLHFGSWYQVHKGGIVDYSFAELFPLHFRYRFESRPSLQAEPGPWHPGRFDWHRHGGDRYDYFLVHSWRDPTPFFRQARAPVRPVAKASGGWWLFANPAALAVATSHWTGEPPPELEEPAL